MQPTYEQQFTQLPASLGFIAEQYWQKLTEQWPDLVTDITEEITFKAKLCFALSDFVAESCIYHQGIFSNIFFDHQSSSVTALDSAIASLCSIGSEIDFIQSIRQTRRLIWVRIAVLDLLKQQSIEQSLQLVSNFSDALINVAYSKAYGQVSQLFGCPRMADGTPMPLTILGMGKLGGMELNYSSDIDLILCYPKSGQTEGGRKSLDNQPFFVKVAQKLIQYLNQNTADGFVFRVDMRLRPFGDSGPLVLSYSAMEDYYQEQGRDWERYAMLKGRVIGNDQLASAQEMQSMLRPFVYRRYIDFSVIESLRKMKQLISQEARRKNTGINIKLGTGGIREVEFIAQALQMIRGGREPQLQVRSLLLALERLKQLDLITEADHQVLVQSYLKLRQYEHYLQQFNDQQTQWLPQDETNQQRLCWLLQQSDWQSCYQHIVGVMGAIHQQFRKIIDDGIEEKSEQLSVYEIYWQLLDPSGDSSVLSYLDESARASFIVQLKHFKNECLKRSIGGRGRTVLDQLIPQLLWVMQQTKEAESTLERVLNVLAKIASRTAYLELLNENTGALKQLVKLCSQSCWIAEQLSLQPILLDELIDPRVLYNPIALNAYQDELESLLIRVAEDDLEQQLEVLRHFKLSKQLHIAAADISKVLTLPEVSSHLTKLAQAIVACVISIAWKQMSQRYGEPEARNFSNKGFAVIGYGKLGGNELGYDSDLDVVFVHDCDVTAATNGAKPIDSRQFYLKLAQRVIHIFTSRTVSGILYEIDTRIRPQGNSGLLACNIKTYDAYLREEAWTWEHQALVRASMVYGSSELKQQFTEIRRQILTQPRALAQLQQEVANMRTKMRDNLAKSSGILFDLKQGLGGVVDIEFITQYLVLAHAHHNPLLIGPRSNLELFELFVCDGIITAEQGEILAHAYRQLRKIGHRLTLQKLDKLTDNEYAKQLSDDIQQIWHCIFTDTQS